MKRYALVLAAGLLTTPTACGPLQTSDTAGDVDRASVGLAYSGARHVLGWLDGRLVAQHEQHATATIAAVKRDGGGIVEYDRRMELWRSQSGWEQRRDRLLRAHAALAFVGEYLNGESSELDAREQAASGLQILDVLMTELESDGVAVPPEVRASVAAARALGSLL